MPNAVRTFKRFALALPVIFLWSCAAVSQPVTPPIDGKAVAEKLIRPNKGAIALVFDENGQPTVVNKEGQIVPACQICTPELEHKYGPQCAKARKVSENPAANANSKMPAATGDGPLICNKLIGTNVQAVKPVTVLKHTGSDCMTFFFELGGVTQAFEYCW